ncbi:hypothetical protein [Staphylococcus schweitzeri]|nr:hypothetical protein [Staphylococcus schweitzeri]
MFENEDKFPNKNEYVCPPNNASSAHGKTLYKLNNQLEIPSDYLKPMIQKGNRPFKTGKDKCLACGHSIFENIEDIKKTYKKIKKLAKPFHKEWKYIVSFEGSSGSKFLKTPSKSNKYHCTYWHFGSEILNYRFVHELEEGND